MYRGQSSEPKNDLNCHKRRKTAHKIQHSPLSFTPRFCHQMWRARLKFPALLLFLYHVIECIQSFRSPPIPSLPIHDRISPWRLCEYNLRFAGFTSHPNFVLFHYLQFIGEREGKQFQQHVTSLFKLWWK